MSLIVTLPEVRPSHFVTHLDPLKPLGLGTDQLECLTSYLIRLANHHWLSSSAANKYAEENHLPRKLQPITRGTTFSLASANGQGVSAVRMATALENATGQQHLLRLTFHSWLPALDRMGKGLLHPILNWCSYCWKDDMQSGTEPYLRLAWISRPVEVCAHHRRPLSSQCPHCHEQQRIVPLLPRCWICQKCGNDLQKKPTAADTARKSKVTPQQLWSSRAIGKLIERTCSDGESLPVACIPRAIRQLLKTNNLGHISSLYDRLNISPGYLTDWYIGKTRPTLLSLIDLCYRLDIPPDQFLLDSDVLTAPALWRNIKTSRFVETDRINYAMKAKIGTNLKAIIQDNPKEPLSVSRLARKFKISYTTLKKHFPQEYKILQERAAEWRKQRFHVSNAQRLDKLTNGVNRLVADGIFPSERQLRRLGYVLSSDLRRPEIITKLRELQVIFRYVPKIDEN